MASVLEREDPVAEDMYVERSSSEPDGAGMAALDFLYRFVAAVELTPNVAVHSCDRDGTVRYWNKSCETLFGVPASEALTAADRGGAPSRPQRRIFRPDR